MGADPEKQPSQGALKALRRVVPWVQQEAEPGSSSVVQEEPEVVSSWGVMSFAASVLPSTTERRPAWAMAGFPADTAELLHQIGLQHLEPCLGDESIVSLALALVAIGNAGFLQRLAALGVTKIGERQKLLSALRRALHDLQGAASSLLSSGPSLEERVAGQAGVNLFAFVSTFPGSEPAAIAALAGHSISIAGVVDAISNNATAIAALVESLRSQSLSWLSDAQLALLRTLAVFVFVCLLDSGLKRTGALSALRSHLRLCEAAGLLPPSDDAHEPWHEEAHTCSIGAGGALLILSPPRTHLWRNLPRSLGVIPAVMGGQLPEDTISECNRAARRTLTRGEIGILHSNAAAWASALEAGWEFALVLEDDANLSDKAQGGCSLPMLLSRLGALVDAATAHEPDWQLIVLTPVNTPCAPMQRVKP